MIRLLTQLLTHAPTWLWPVLIGFLGLLAVGTQSSIQPELNTSKPMQNPTSNSTARPTGQTPNPDSSLEKAIFGAGCFWGVEANFRKQPGVIATQVGYAGGTVENPTYEQVCTDTTNHAEVVEVTYDPSQITYEALLDVFWKTHNPTTPNRQGPDIGRQYRSVIFCTTDSQQETAERAKAALEASQRFERPIVTEIRQAPTFYPAEDYHQQYYEKKGISGCGF